MASTSVSGQTVAKSMAPTLLWSAAGATVQGALDDGGFELRLVEVHDADALFGGEHAAPTGRSTRSSAATPCPPTLPERSVSARSRKRRRSNRSRMLPNGSSGIFSIDARRRPARFLHRVIGQVERSSGIGLGCGSRHRQPSPGDQGREREHDRVRRGGAGRRPSGRRWPGRPVGSRRSPGRVRAGSRDARRARPGTSGSRGLGR